MKTGNVMTDDPTKHHVKAKKFLSLRGVKYFSNCNSRMRSLHFVPFQYRIRILRTGK
jgi:hypothetical protein